MKKFSKSYSPCSEKKIYEEIKDHYYFQMLDRHIGRDWQSSDIIERVTSEEVGEEYYEKVTTYYVDGIPRLRLEPKYKPNGLKISFTVVAVYL